MHPPIVQTFDRRRNYNGVKINRKICFRGDIVVYVKMHKLINLQNSVNNEPEDVAEVLESILP